MRRRTASPPAARGEDGFTVVELLVTMTLAVVVLFAVLGAADVFTRTAAKATNLSTSQESARSTLRDVTDALRQARLPLGETSPIQHTSTSVANDLVAAGWVGDASGVSQPGWVRYCVSADGTSLLYGRRIAESWAGAGAPGACVATASNSTTTPATGWVYATVIDRSLADGPVFDFTSDTCFGTTGTACPPPATAVRAVGIRLGITDGSGGSNARGTTLYGAVSLRNRS